jgi:small subunit ribosomal protein S17
MGRSIIGIVVSDKVDKTIVIKAHSQKTHPIYKKQYPVTIKFMAHDPDNKARIGDEVEISECRPLSARKRFILSKIIQPAKISSSREEDAKIIQKASQKNKPTVRTKVDKEILKDDKEKVKK